MPWSAWFVLVARSIPHVKLTALTVTVPVALDSSSNRGPESALPVLTTMQCIIAVALNARI
jgi:hypothetical protein